MGSDIEDGGDRRASDADDLVCLVDSDGRLRQWTDRVTAVSGGDDDRLVGAPADDVLDDPETGRFAAAVERATTDGRAVFEADVGGIPHEFVVSPLHGEDGTLAVHATPVTRATDQARPIVTFLQDVYELTTDPEVAFDEKVDRLLERGCAEVGLEYGFLTRIETDEDGTGGTQTVTHSVSDHPDLRPGDSCPLSKAYCRKTIETSDLLTLHDAVAAGWEDDPAYDAFGLGAYIGAKILVDGDLHGTLCFASTDPHDRFTPADRMVARLVAKWVSYELERRLATERLRRRNERLDQFATIVSHDLRNPLNVAEGRLDLVRENCDDENLATVAAAHERMRSLIDDLLTWARMEEADLDLTDVDLAATVESCWATVDTTTADLAVGTTAVLRADESRLRQLLENLFRNAVDHAGADVHVEVGDLPAGDGFYVADDGPGIPAEKRDEVFESGYSSDPEGTGLGLSIVAQIAEAHGWSVAATESEAGGARFEVTGVTTPS